MASTTTQKQESLSHNNLMATKQEPSHSSAKRVRGPSNIYSKLLPINLTTKENDSHFIAKLLPLFRPSLDRSALLPRITGRYERITNSIWIINGRLTLWQQGFFGKGSLSRSEPTWLQRAKNRMLLEVLEDDRYLKLTAEELTAKRRVERKESKIQKSKLKQQVIETIEKGNETINEETTNEVVEPVKENKIPAQRQKLSELIPEELALEVEKIEDLEHLQLMNEEAFFLCLGLGCLDVSLSDQELESETTASNPLTILEMWDLFCHASIQDSQDQTIRADNPFILSYVVYHHFRSLGWVVRSGIKFCADWVLYGSRGPVGGHAEFAVCMIPVYANGKPVQMMEDRSSWRWLSTVNRVCSGVKKTLILVHVIVPDDIDSDELDSPSILTKYIIKEIALKRFIPARMRD
ncbi:hypothetical protein MJO28_015222 [Puccinia striiformis f. sp. tritici]|uniref:tRNA-splicing endonuclease subunit Sen2 n=2 Tax=Puccinia striiformis f. sp. tritici TaxID=168172 RepID=A0A0L0VVF0_9BASI|nr:hypothetical protein Pst134EA_028060 [Puccinia striiformis f. sp. tritici]KAI9607818.1 hypothetical protein H4Q26_005263 [Puccinia striiformis f. sp. tritici PST-130]KNF03258.1 hypothetical protein PSTG_03523 [Puccinia striiformis f. sp. tritici PST-78]KAH9448764.1 hypothetical protein Pst134EA_028060 [Puccinia striiformis f. sp. tritici]KAI7937676.1 hypothetical protein MJO29_014991 [Puccinia striiformis f. sp. tritici]KAI7938302.1 hypothetical protein MJO28_015222 [Puccinia striiformis f.